MKIRAALMLLADAMQAHEQLLSIEDLMGLCDSVAPSDLCTWCFEAVTFLMFLHVLMCVLVPTGGLILESYLDTLATPLSHEVWRKHCKFVKAHGICEMPPDQFAVVCKKERGKFHGYLVMATSNLRPKSKKQQFYLTFSARYHGLSRTGVRILAYYGFLTKLTQMDKLEKQELQASRQRVRYCTHFMLGRCWMTVLVFL